MWCPICGDEFQPGLEQCVDCQVLLVEDPPDVPLVGLRNDSVGQLLSFPNQDPDAVFEHAVTAARALRRWKVVSEDVGERVARCSVGWGVFRGCGVVEIAVLAGREGGSLLRFHVRYESNEGTFAPGASCDEGDRYRSELERVLGLPSKATGL